MVRADDSNIYQGACLLCGVTVPGPQSQTAVDLSHPGLVFREDQWNNHRKTQLEHVMVPADEVERAYFHKFQPLWSCACRASESFLLGT